jgi:glycosyltransferase involved in cell wall biosynthesis
MPKLTVVIPVFNESATINTLLEKVEAQHVYEIIIVDDASTDDTLILAKATARRYGNIKVLSLPRNVGKGNALRNGFALAEGDIVLIQDADLEYDPQDYIRILEAFNKPSVSLVYGSRFLGDERSTLFRARRRVNRIMTSITNFITGMTLTDVHTCYKAFRKEVLQQISLKEDRFGFCTEVTIKAAKAGYDIVEVPISYNPRTINEGKKIRFKDGIRSVWCNIKYGIFG